ncbi:hypothetical protein ABZ705_28090 [Streptomyces sp. NPDC006984]|uniref:hypothetical protein n=1 Tax=Streptomyces sp. NPDC006984 TaxID=3155463 RepID=UPI0033D1AEA2
MNDQHSNHETTSNEAVTWLRPEFQGREDELINLAAGAALVGVTRSAVSNWAARHRNFPKPALLTGLGARRVKWVPREEFLDFARLQLAKDRGSWQRARKDSQQRQRRPSTQIHAERAAHYERQVLRLKDLEKRQADRLRSTQDALRDARAKLREARRKLAAELEAGRQASGTT